MTVDGDRAPLAADGGRSSAVPVLGLLGVSDG